MGCQWSFTWAPYHTPGSGRGQVPQAHPVSQNPLTTWLAGMALLLTIDSASVGLTGTEWSRLDQAGGQLVKSDTKKPAVRNYSVSFHSWPIDHLQEEHIATICGKRRDRPMSKYIPRTSWQLLFPNDISRVYK